MLIWGSSATLSRRWHLVAEGPRKKRYEFSREAPRRDAFYELMNHYVEKGPGLKPIRPGVSGRHALPTGVQTMPCFSPIRAHHACGWRGTSGVNRRLFGSFTWASMANAAPTPSALNWRIQDGKRSPCAATADSPCWAGRSADSGAAQDGGAHIIFKTNPSTSSASSSKRPAWCHLA